MLYLKCPSCKTILGNKQLPFEEKMAAACGNSKLSEDESNAIKMKILDELELERYCCRMRILSYVKQIEFIK